jgi:hypothetical protein
VGTTKSIWKCGGIRKKTALKKQTGYCQFWLCAETKTNKGRKGKKEKTKKEELNNKAITAGKSVASNCYDNTQLGALRAEINKYINNVGNREKDKGKRQTKRKV